jgi:NAD(P)-dependent dehydrogenase (short-subunit alcohol dehydrogenase family)
MTSRRTAIVTGAGSGIGRAASVALAEAGFDVMLAGRRAGPLEETARLIGSAAQVQLADVTDSSSVEQLFSAAKHRWGRLDLLFNNAGASLPPTRLDEITDEDWDRLIAVNLSGAFLCLRAAFRVMRDQDPQGGRIINNGSLSAHVPRLHSATYTATKHAITGLTKSALLDGRELGIACGQIDIGNAASDMGGTTAAGALQADGNCATEPLISVEAVAAAIVHMAELPLEANIPFMKIMASGMPFFGRG